MAKLREVVVITGSSGHIGTALIHRLAPSYRIAGFDEPGPPYPARPAHCIPVDMESQDSIDAALASVRHEFGDRIALVIHLAGYYSFSGDPSPKYQTVNVHGTRRLLEALQAFHVERFAFASTMLVHRPTAPGRAIDEDSPVDPKWDYSRSKLEAESVIARHRREVPCVILRIAGVYDEDCGVPTLANQIQMVYERQLVSHVFPGDSSHGQAFVHLEDLVEAFASLAEKRKELPPELRVLVGEPETYGYAMIQSELGRLIHGEEWETREIPKALAKTGAWLEEVALPKDKEPFVKPWMIDMADDHYELDTRRARELLAWEPRHRLIDTLPDMVYRLKANPADWYRKNNLHIHGDLEKHAGTPAAATSKDGKKSQQDHEAMKHGHKTGPGADDDMLVDEHLGTLWAHFVNLMLGLWLLASPFALGYLSAHGADANILRVTAERALSSPEARSLAMAWSDAVSGALIVGFSLLSLSPKRRFPWAQWANAAVGFWLLFAPLVFWSPLPVAYVNDTLIGALVIAFSVLISVMPGMSMEGMMGRPDVAPGWDYTPSSWLQRLPIAALAFIGFLIARYLTAYQLGYIDRAWDPFFGDGTMTIITSDVSKAWPIPDAGVGAVAYMMELLMAVMGDKRRWRTMPWMVLAFVMLVVPLGVVSIFFIIIQPISIGTWCTLCLIAALAMVVMIPYSLDELVAMGQFMLAAKREGKSLWRSFWMGGAMKGGTKDKAKEFRGSLPGMIAEMVDGVTMPWTLVASIGLGVWLMFTRLAFGSSGSMANSDHLVGSLVVTFSVMAMAEVARPVRFINVAFGAWLIAAPWWLSGVGSALATWNCVAIGLALVVLALPRGKVRKSYAGWDRYIV